VAEFSRECLNPNLPDREPFQHCFNGNLRADEGTAGLQIKFVDQVAPDQAEACADIAESAFE
jgi:hypothetical protein